MVTRDSPWDDKHRARAEALLLKEDTTCGGCGLDLVETMRPGGLYDVDNETVCEGCRAKESVQRVDRHNHQNDKVPLGRFEHEDGRIYTVRLTGREEPKDGR